MHYVDKSDLDRQWDLWYNHADPVAWEMLAIYIYKICYGVAVKFSPRNEEEREEYAHHTFALILAKIKNGKLVNLPHRGE